MMRRLSFFLFAPMLACGSTPGAADPTPGVRGGALTSSLAVHVVAEDDLLPLPGASVDVGGASVTTDANGDATLVVSASPATVHVALSGYVGERWLGVDRDHVTVGLARPIPARALRGTVTGGTEGTRVAAATALTMLRTSSPLGSVDACTADACDVSLTVETLDPAIDVLLVDSTEVRLAPHVALDGDHFAIDASAATALPSLVTLQATIPDAPGLQEVVGVPGIARGGAVSLIAGPSATTTSLLAPAIEGPLAGDRLWFVAHAQTADGHGESMIFDRDVQGASVHLPSAFLAIPITTTTTDIRVMADPQVTFYVLEAFGATDAERVLVLHPSGQVSIPVALADASRMVLRAVATTGDASDLVDAEARADRIATVTF